MTADVFSSISYAALQQIQGVHKNTGYAIVGQSASVDSKGYAVAAAGPAQVRTAPGYSALNLGGGVPSSKGHVAIANPASVPSYVVYALFGSDPANIPTGYGYAVLHSFYPPFEDVTLDYSFIEQRFPECVSFGSQGGPGFKTSVFSFDSGFAAVEAEWDRLRGRYVATFENATPADVEEVEEFFYGMRGRALGFRYKDWSDYQITNQNIAIGDGTTTTFQIFKRYESGGHVFDRMIKKIAKGTADVSMDGVQLLEGSDYFILDAHGQIVFPTAVPSGSVATINYIEYDVPVRFDTDKLNVAYDDFRQLNLEVPLIEILI